MDLLVAISQIAGSLALVVTVVVLLRELRENNRLTRAANTQALVAIASPFNLAIIQDRNVATLCVRGGADLTDDVDRYRHRTLVIYWLIFHENVYFQWRQGLLDDRIHAPWERDLRTFLAQHHVEQMWPQIKALFQDEFASYVAAMF